MSEISMPSSVEEASEELAAIDRWLQETARRQQQAQTYIARAAFLNGFIEGLKRAAPVELQQVDADDDSEAL